MTLKYENLQCLYYRWDRFMKYAVEVTSGDMICSYIPRFFRYTPWLFGTSLQIIFRYWITSMRFWNVGIIYLRNLRNMSLQWPQVAWCACQSLWRSISDKPLGKDTRQTHWKTEITGSHTPNAFLSMFANEACLTQISSFFLSGKTLDYRLLPWVF
jgi:hypothetical protein